MNNSAKVFMVEDDLNFGSVMKAYLELNDYTVTWINDGKHALREFREGNYDICILDVMLPNIDGFTIARDIKTVNKNIPLIFLTAKTLKQDVMEGFKIGADDYITKPFDSEVLIMKMKAILNRHIIQEEMAHVENGLQIGKFFFDYKLRTITLNNIEQKLSPKEADLLKMLCLKRNDILTREEALKTLWGDDSYFNARSMDVFITKLRKYLKDDQNIEIANLHGSGFRLIIKNQ